MIITMVVAWAEWGWAAWVVWAEWVWVAWAEWVASDWLEFRTNPNLTCKTIEDHVFNGDINHETEASR